MSDYTDKVLGAIARAEQRAKTDPEILKESKPLRAAVVDEVSKLIAELMQVTGERATRAEESVERAVNNAYEDAKATVMEQRPPCRSCAEAITNRQREVMGAAEADAPDKPAGPIVPPEQWGFGGPGMRDVSSEGALGIFMGGGEDEF